MPSTAEKNLNAFGGFSVGLITGNATGAQKRKYPVGGQQAYFEAFKKELKSR